MTTTNEVAQTLAFLKPVNTVRTLPLKSKLTYLILAGNMESVKVIVF